MTYAQILQTNGLQNAEALVSAANKVGLALHIAAAFVQQESEGANIYGHDAGGLFPGQAVTEANFADFVSQVQNGHTSNGVGPMQITYPGYFTQAKSQGYDLANPEDNMVFGFRIVKGFLANHALDAAAQIYNSGSSTGNPTYGAAVVGFAAEWEMRLASVTSVQSPVSSVPITNAPLSTDNRPTISFNTLVHNIHYGGLTGGTFPSIAIVQEWLGVRKSRTWDHATAVAYAREAHGAGIPNDIDVFRALASEHGYRVI